jgi:hypothetical protein
VEAALTQIQGWAAELDALITRIAPRFTRGEVRRHVGAFLRGLLVGSTASRFLCCQAAGRFGRLGGGSWSAMRQR